MLRKARYVMEVPSSLDVDNRRVNFIVPPDDRHTGARTCLLFDRLVWDDMGQPDTITVTVRPGDRLN